MKMNELHKKFLISTAGPIITGMALATGNAADIDATFKIGDSKTITMPGRNQQEADKGRVSFEVDASGVDPMKYLFSKRIAIVFEGETTGDRRCPYIATDEREPKYTELGNRVFRVETPAAPEEIDAVKAEGCLITESPPVRSILGGNKP